MHLRLKGVVWCIVDWGVDFENIHLATLKLRSFVSIWNQFFKNMLTQPIFGQRVCMGVDKYAFEVEGCFLVYCWWGVDFENIHLATLKLRSFASIWNLFFKNMLTQLIFAQRVCMGVDKYVFEVEGCFLVYCWWGVDFENIHLATLKLRSFVSIWNQFFKNMLTQPIFAQRVCMGVDKYAFQVEGCCLVYCWWGVDIENIHLATLKLRSFASIWNLFVKNMLTQPIFAQRVCMGVDKYVFEVEGCFLVYCCWGVDFENIHLATLKLRSFVSIWNQFFKNMLTQPIFGQRVCMGVDKYAFQVEGCCLVYCWWGVDIENIHLATLKLRSFASIWNLFVKNMLTQPIFAQRGCMGVDKFAFEVEGYCLVYCWRGVDFQNIHLATLKLRSFASIWNQFFKNMLTQPIFAQRVCMGVDKYAFQVEGCCLVYCWWGVDIENIHLATLKLRSFASIWNLFFKYMLTQLIFAQRVCMGVDKYAFEVEGCCLVYCWWGVDVENIHLATLKLRSFVSIWNQFFKNMLTQPIFVQRVCMGVDKYAFQVEGCCLVYCWWGVDIENIHLATLKLRSFASIWNLFVKNMLTQPIFAQRGCMGVDKFAFEVEGYCLVYCWRGVDFQNIHLATLKLRSFASIWNQFFKNMLTRPIFAQRVCMGVDKYVFEVEGCFLVYCWWGVDFENIHLATFKLRLLASIWNLFFKYMLTQPFLLKGCAWEWTNMHLRLKGVVWCIVDEE